MTSRIDHNNPHGDGELGLPYHYEMISDTKRVKPFKDAIQQICKDKVVVESGTGTGIMSILAARAGAKAVFAFELDPNIASFARGNFKKTGLNTLKLIQKSTLDSTLDDLDGLKADVVIAENLSTWLVTEPQIAVMNHMNQHLAKPDAIFLPGTVTNQAQLCFTDYVFEDVIDLKTIYFLFSGIPAPRPLSTTETFNIIDFKQQNPLEFKDTMSFEITENGIINCLKLISPIQVYEAIHFDQSDSLMPPVVIPLDKELAVRKGQTIDIRIRFKSFTDWNQFECETLSKEFKFEAVMLLERGEQSPNEIAMDLGIRPNQLYMWQTQLRQEGADTFCSTSDKPLVPGDEVTRLRNELNVVKQERDILKKAAAYFAREVS